MIIDYRSKIGNIHARRKYIKSMIQSALRASDFDTADWWRAELEKLEGK